MKALTFFKKMSSFGKTPAPKPSPAPVKKNIPKVKKK
jgi:hypothetical protein